MVGTLSGAGRGLWMGSIVRIVGMVDEEEGAWIWEADSKGIQRMRRDSSRRC